MVKDLLNANCAKAELRALEAYSFEQLLHVQCAHSRHFFFISSILPLILFSRMFDSCAWSYEN